jgi:outer membrane murein-binding lipoprotein Lpp
MSNIPEEYLSDFDFGFSAVSEPPASGPIKVDTSEISGDVEGINDNVLRIEQKMDAAITAINTLSTRLMSLDDDFDVIKEQKQAEVQEKLTQVEKLIMPLLVNLLKSADQAYIHWPNRTATVQSQIDKLLAITRGS